MSRLYRRCGGCHRTEKYCNCGQLQDINYDTGAAVVGNSFNAAYFGTKNFGFIITTEDGQQVRGPQFQGIAYDGTYMYISVCDKDDRNGCIIKYKNDGTLVKIGPLITDIGHAKIGYSFADACLYVAQRKLGNNWTAAGMHKVDPDTLASVAYNSAMSSQVVAFVQCDKDLYYVNSDSTKLYAIYDIDVVAGTLGRDLITSIPVPADFYTQFDGTGLGVQAWWYDGRTITAVRNNPQFAMIYDTITKKTTLTHIGDVAEYRNIGEIEGAYTWEGRTVFISVNDIADPISNAAGDPEADIYVLFWYWDTGRAASGSLNYRENTHPGYNVGVNFNDNVFAENTTNRSVIVNTAADNFYCNGSQEFPFHSLGEAIDYYRNVGTFNSIQFQADFTGFARLFNAKVSFTHSSGVTVSLRLCDTQNCDIWLDGITFHDCEYYKCNVYILKNCSRGAAEYDNYYKAGELNPVVSKLYNGTALKNVYFESMIYIDSTNTGSTYADMIDLDAPGDILRWCNIIQLTTDIHN